MEKDLFNCSSAELVQWYHNAYTTAQGALGQTKAELNYRAAAVYLDELRFRGFSPLPDFNDSGALGVTNGPGSR